MLRTPKTPDPVFTDTLALDLSSVEPVVAGPRRPQDRVALERHGSAFETSLDRDIKKHGEISARVSRSRARITISATAMS